MKLLSKLVLSISLKKEYPDYDYLRQLFRHLCKELDAEGPIVEAFKTITVRI